MVGLGLGPRTRLGPRTNRWMSVASDERSLRSWMSAASDERSLRSWKSWHGFLCLYMRSIAHHLEHRVQLAIRNRSHTSHCTTTISCYQTRPVRSLLTPSRDTHTYRRSLPIYQSRNTTIDKIRTFLVLGGVRLAIGIRGLPIYTRYIPLLI